MRQIMIVGILILIGLAAGTGIGLMINKPQIDAARLENEELNTRLQASETQSLEKQRTASEEIARLRADLMRARNDLTRLNTDLARAKTELAQATPRPASEQAPGASAPPSAVRPAPGSTEAKPAAVSAPAAAAAPVKQTLAPAGPIREYVIKDGDSFWKIAASQLGSGARYKEIIDLNPALSPDKPLVIGTKIKIPPK